MPEANTSCPTGRAGGTSWPRGSVGGAGQEQHGQNGNGLPALSPGTPAHGDMLPKAKGWVAGGQCPVTRAGWGDTPERPLQRGLSQALAAPVQQNRQMATSVPLWPPVPGGAGQSGPGCGTAWPGALDSGSQRVMAWPSPSPERG